MSNKKLISCGIDFGTTNTSAAINDNIFPPLLVNVEKEDTSIPSTIFFPAKKGKISFGKDALDKYMKGETGRFMRSLKRVLGTNLMNAGTRINDSSIKFDKILTYFLQNIKDKIDVKAKQQVENVVMGRPVHFRDNDEKGDAQAESELRQIAKNVGFKNIEFQYEPIAAAFAHEAKIEEEKLACVIDIGGGTSDFSIIKVGSSLSRKLDRKDDILANTGVRIGGNDFDKNLSLKTFMPEFGMGSTYGGRFENDKLLTVPNSPFFDLSEWSSINSLYNYKIVNMVENILLSSNDPKRYGRLLEIIESEQGHKLLNEVENTKIGLTKEENVKTILNFLKDSPIVLSNRLSFEEAIENSMEKVSNSVKECIKQAGIKDKDVRLIVLTGGSTEIPNVKNTLCSYFPNAELSEEDKFSSVGLGLAYDSARRFN
ncbi:MAG: Hsp70 family protein [Rickettsiales bacterium]|jgi:hypothetical chaperone protein|nr:Hsp70 family protein [Rickettsiales bacterium]